jgi:tetratricopeptide (TPR) repeat protein
MVQPTPFQRLLQDSVQLANRDPQAAFARLDELFGKSLTAEDVLALASFSVHLGASGLGRFAETAAFQQRLLDHPALTTGTTSVANITRSLWRGLAVVHRCAGKHAEADEAEQHGVGNDSDRCRLAVMTAQTLAVRGRANDAVAHLRKAALLARDLDPKDEVVVQVATVAGNLLRLAEPQVKLAQELLLAAAAASSAALTHAGDWRVAHKAWFQHGQAYLLAARPTQALRCVQAMMELEDRHDAGPFERFATASLACRAQAVRGQLKIASGALEACQYFVKRIEHAEQAKQAQAALTELETFVAQAREA